MTKELFTSAPYKIADMSLADFGRKEIEMAQHEMPGLMALREKYGKGKDRQTEIREFDSIEATKVAVSNAKLYVDRAEGFFGIGKAMKDSEYVCDCSDIDDVRVIWRDGRYLITKFSEKRCFYKNI